MTKADVEKKVKHAVSACQTGPFECSVGRNLQLRCQYYPAHRYDDPYGGRTECPEMTLLVVNETIGWDHSYAERFFVVDPGNVKKTMAMELVLMQCTRCHRVFLKNNLDGGTSERLRQQHVCRDHQLSIKADPEKLTAAIEEITNYIFNKNNPLL